MSKRSNPAVAPIGTITDDPQATVKVMIDMKAGIETLAGQRGTGMDRAVTFRDLLELGLVTDARVRALLL